MEWPSLSDLINYLRRIAVPVALRAEAGILGEGRKVLTREVSATEVQFIAEFLGFLENLRRVANPLAAAVRGSSWPKAFGLSEDLKRLLRLLGDPSQAEHRSP